MWDSCVLTFGTAHSKLRDPTFCLELQKITFSNWKANILTCCLLENLGPWSKQDIVCMSCCQIQICPACRCCVYTQYISVWIVNHDRDSGRDKGIVETTLCLWTANAYGHNIARFLWMKVLYRFIKYINIDEIKSAIIAIKLGGLLTKRCPFLVDNILSLRLFSTITKINL
jgi:hypothetical protein